MESDTPIGSSKLAFFYIAGANTRTTLIKTMLYRAKRLSSPLEFSFQEEYEKIYIIFAYLKYPEIILKSITGGFHQCYDNLQSGTKGQEEKQRCYCFASQRSEICPRVKKAVV